MWIQRFTDFVFIEVNGNEVLPIFDEINVNLIPTFVSYFNGKKISQVDGEEGLSKMMKDLNAMK